MIIQYQKHTHRYIYQRWKKFFSFWDPGFRIKKFLQIFQEANWQNNKIIVSAYCALC